MTISLAVFNDSVKSVDASQVAVEVNRAQGWISIKDTDSEEGVFLQGDEGYDFIDGADGIWNELQEVTLDDCYKFMAYPYLDML